MSKDEKGQSKAEQVKGTIKETAGKATGDEGLEAEGKAERAKGKLREGKEDVKDAARGAADGLRRDDGEGRN